MTLAPLAEPSPNRPPPKPARAVSRLIADTGFDDHDRDIGTAGLCGTFAMALHDRLAEAGIPAVPVLAHVGKVPCDLARLAWRHALIDVNGVLFDIEGDIEPEHAIANYCWGTTSPETGMLRVGFADFSEIIRRTRNAYDRSWYNQWTRMLRRSPLDDGSTIGRCR